MQIKVYVFFLLAEPEVMITWKEFNNQRIWYCQDEKYFRFGHEKLTVVYFQNKKIQQND